MRSQLPIVATVLLAGCFTLPAPLVVQSPAAAETTAVDAAIVCDEAVAVAATGDAVVAQLAQASAVLHDLRCRVALENLANVGTCAWKRRIVRTTTQSIVGADGTPHAMPVLVGVESVFAQGALELTQRALDLAIDGEGFFAVLGLDGTTGYTRAGSLQVNADGKLVTSTGQFLLPEITLPSDTLEIAVDPEGRVAGRTAGSPDTSTQFGQLTLHRFVNPAGLRVDGETFRATDDSGAPITGQPGSAGLGMLKQGFLERSNVENARETMDLQIGERNHQAFLAALRQLGWNAN